MIKTVTTISLMGWRVEKLNCLDHTNNFNNMNDTKGTEKKNEIIDGLEALTNLFSNDKALLIEHVITNTYFFEKDSVLDYTTKTCKDICEEKAIPVRYTSTGSFFQNNEHRRTTPNIKSRKEAVHYYESKKDDKALYHKETEIKIRFDNDGNYAPKQFIKEYTGHLLSRGESSTIQNFIIAHIWNKTDNPLYFSLPWNYVLMPCHCAYITDKRDDSNGLVKDIKDLIKAVSIELYNPNKIMNIGKDQDVITSADMPDPKYLIQARQLIDADKITFLKHIS